MRLFFRFQRSACKRVLSSVAELANYGQKAFDVDRLDEQAGIIPAHRKTQRRGGGDDRDREIREPLVLMNALDELPSVHHGHFQVEEHERRANAGPQDLQRLPPVSRADGAISLALEQVHQQIEGILFVVDDENAPLGAEGLVTVFATPPLRRPRSRLAGARDVRGGRRLFPRPRRHLLQQNASGPIDRHFGRGRPTLQDSRQSERSAFQARRADFLREPRQR
jgi:hypothetical protein